MADAKYTWNPSQFRIHRYVHVLAILVSLFTPDFPKAGVGDWTTFTFTNEVRSIIFDGDDLWLASGGGIVKYEETIGRFTAFTNTDGLSGNDVSSLAIDSNRDIWIGTAGAGLSRRRHDTGTFRTFSLLDGLASNQVNALFRKDNTLWVGTDDGISLFVWGRDADEERDTFVFSDAYRASRGVPVGNLNGLVVTGDTIWAATETGVATARTDAPNLKDPVAWTTYSPVDGLPDTRVTSLAVSGSEIWAGTRSGVARFDGSTWIPVNTGLLSTEIRDISFIEGVLWAATVSEVARFDGAVWTSVGGGVGLEGARAVEGSVDGSTVWIGTSREGLARLESGSWRFLPSAGPRGNVIDAIHVSRDSRLWFGFNNGGVSSFDGLSWQSYGTADGLVDGAISMVGEHFDGRLWFGSFGSGLSRFDEGLVPDTSDDQWETFDETNSVFEGVPEDPGFVVVNAWAEDGSGGQWFSDFGVGAQYLDPSGAYTTFREGVASLSSARIRDICIDTSGSIWFATDSRLSRYDPDSRTWSVFGTSDGLLSPQINGVASSVTGDVWAGTDAGITRIAAGDIITSLGLPAGLNTSRVTALRTDARGNVWVGSPSGLARFDPDSFAWEVFTSGNSPLADDLIKTIAVNQQEGEIWVGTGQGISRFESGVLPARATQGTVPVYPNPFIPSQGDTEVVFGSLADGARVSILTVDGRLVRQIAPIDIVAQQARWDGRNASGAMVAGGVYFFVISAPDGSHSSGKIAVIR